LEIHVQNAMSGDLSGKMSE